MLVLTSADDILDKANNLAEGLNDANAMLEGRLGPGDIMAATLVMLNLYAPLNILGFAYREIKQGAADMEAMFALP